MHPNPGAVYRKKVEELETLLEDAAQKDEAMALIRSLIDKIVLTPREEGGLDAVLHGDLARILALCICGSEQADALSTIRATSVAASAGLRASKNPWRVCGQGFLVLVAGTGFEPVTFRL